MENEINCHVTGSIKREGSNYWDLVDFCISLPQSEADHLLNNTAGVENLIRMKYPSATEIHGAYLCW